MVLGQEAFFFSLKIPEIICIITVVTYSVRFKSVNVSVTRSFTPLGDTKLLLWDVSVSYFTY